MSPFLVLLLLLCLFFQQSISLTCPPFPSTPPTFPFSPPFQIHCNSNSTSSSTISIHNQTFKLLTLTSKSSLLLKPLISSKNTTCSSLTHISFSHSPFRLRSCLPASLVSCSSFHLPNCSRCPFDCQFVKSPLLLLPICHSTNRKHQTPNHCHRNVSILSSLEDFFSHGVEVEWDLKEHAGSVGPNMGSRANKAVVQCVVVLLVFVILSSLIGFLVFRSRRRKLEILSHGQDPTVLYLQRHRSASLLPPVFTYEELELATNRFDSRRKIGDGGFGSVFLGQLYDGRIVAVKHLHRRCIGGKAFLTNSFCNEILILSSIEHLNLVKLYGYCSDRRGLILVYDYVSNGTLFEHLHKKAFRKGVMTWHVRVEIALQIALAIEYLHFSVVPPIVHRDITSSNIFVEKDMRIKVGDFGLSRLLVFSEKSTEMGSDGCVWTGPQGTPGYLDPDYHRSFRLTEKSDVYSFGVVLLELVTGLKAVDQRRDTREVALADMATGRIQMGLLNQLLDPALVAEGSNGEGIEAMAELAFRCVAMDKDDRPDAREVVAELRRIRNRPRGSGALRAASNLMKPADSVLDGGI